MLDYDGDQTKARLQLTAFCTFFILARLSALVQASVIAHFSGYSLQFYLFVST